MHVMPAWVLLLIGDGKGDLVLWKIVKPDFGLAETFGTWSY